MQRVRERERVRVRVRVLMRVRVRVLVRVRVRVLDRGGGRRRRRRPRCSDALTLKPRLVQLLYRCELLAPPRAACTCASNKTGAEGKPGTARFPRL